MIPILISPETIWKDEKESLLRLFESGLQFYHLRKPEADAVTVRSFMQEIPSEFHKRIVLHYQFELAEEFNWKGFHFNKKNIDHLSDLKHLGKLSSYSAHSFEEVESLMDVMDYQFLSPVFNSISKEGYKSNFDLQELSSFLQKVQTKIVALGGVKPQHWEQLSDCGFYGAAVLGYIWENGLSTEDRVERFKQLRTECSTGF